MPAARADLRLSRVASGLHQPGAIENIHRAEFIANSKALSELNTPAVSVTARILDRGRASGVFLHPADAIDVHMLISAFCFFRVFNRHTSGAIFGLDMLDRGRRDHYRKLIGDMIVSYPTFPDDLPG